MNSREKKQIKKEIHKKQESGWLQTSQPNIGWYNRAILKNF